MGPSSGDSSAWQWLGGALHAVIGWVDRNEHTLQALAFWGAISEACEKTQLYVPRQMEAWAEIAKACEGEPAKELREMILSLYGPGGVGHDALRAELDAAPLLRERHQEVSEIVVSIADGRYYVAICGALPLIEGALMSARGSWKAVDDVKDELVESAYESGKLTSDEIADLLGAAGAVSMVLHEVPTIWKPRPHKVGAVREELNRHFIAHGTGTGWATRPNAIRATLLLAAVARVAGPLLRPRA